MFDSTSTRQDMMQLNAASLIATRDVMMDVSLEDVSGVFRLIREVCDRWDDPQKWREHLLHGACQLVNGHSANILADYDHQPGWFGTMAVIATVGLPAAVKPLLQPYVSQID